MPSLALGTSPVKPIEMVNAYSMFANGGKEVKPTFIRRIMDHEGNILYDAHLESKQVLDKSKAFVMEEMTGMFDLAAALWLRQIGSCKQERLVDGTLRGNGDADMISA